MELAVDLSNVLQDAWNPHPDEVVRAINEELNPAISFLESRAGGRKIDAVRWILMELATNAVNALFSHALIERTGASREELLSVFKANPLWGDACLKRLESHPVNPMGARVEQALGMRLSEFLRLSQAGKFRQAGVFDFPHGITVACRIPGDGSFEVDVASPVPPSPGDLREVAARFERYEETKALVIERRAGTRDQDGMYWLPSFTGGGGMGLLACIAKAAESGLSFRFMAEEAAAGKTVFRLSSAGSGSHAPADA